MRNGILLAEDTPQNIMTTFNTTTLEDAFLILSQKQGESEEADNTLMRITNNSESEDTTEATETKDAERKKEQIRRNMSFAEQKPPGLLGKLRFTSKSRMKALLTKNFLQLIRQKAYVFPNIMSNTVCCKIIHKFSDSSGLLLLFLFPVLQCTCFYLAIGDNPKNLKIGIVNDEVDHYEDCFNKSLITTTVHDDTCDLNKVSCRYLSRIPPDLTRQVMFM